MCDTESIRGPAMPEPLHAHADLRTAIEAQSSAWDVLFAIERESLGGQAADALGLSIVLSVALFSSCVPKD